MRYTLKQLSVFNVKLGRKQNYLVDELMRIPLSTRHLEPEFGLIDHGRGQLSRVASAVVDACAYLKSEGAFCDFVVTTAENRPSTK